LRDYEKFNLLQLAGYRVLVYTPDQLARGKALAALRVLLTHDTEQEMHP
jgi:hypothetical protein